MTAIISCKQTTARWLAGAALVAVVAVAGLLVLWREPGAPAGSLPVAAAAGANNTSQTNDGGQVTVTVTRQESSTGFTFAIVLDTHVVDLDSIDLRERATLRVGETELRPTGWDAPAGGHHRRGTLRFPATDATGAVELIIRDVAAIPARSFQWPEQ